MPSGAAMMAAPANTTLLVGYQSSPNQRGTLDIVQTCAITIFLCTYTSMCLNVRPNLSRIRLILYKCKWVLFTLFCPELVTAVAAEQWRSARQSIQDFRSLREQQSPFKTKAKDARSDSSIPSESSAKAKRTVWTATHGSFADMGGLHIQFNGSDPFPLNWYQLHWLVEHGYMDYPDIEEKTILDKDKADIFARVATLLQVLWFTVQCIARGFQHLSLTTLELLTLTFSWCALHSSFFWREKPLDVDEAIVLRTERTLAFVLQESGQRIETISWHTRTPLDFVQPPPRFSYTEPFFTAFIITFDIKIPQRCTPVSTFDNTTTIPPHGLTLGDIAFATVFVPLYCGIHLVAWNFSFPTEVERIAWRSAAIAQGITCTIFILACWPGHKLGKFILGAAYPYTVQQAAAWPIGIQKALITAVTLIYFLSRGYIIVEGFLSLRRQPVIVYQAVDWWSLVPHL